MSRNAIGRSILAILALPLALGIACSGSDDGGDGDGSTDGGGDGPGAADGGGPADAATADGRPPPVCPDQAEVSFAADVQPIFTASCTGAVCHDGVGSAAGLNLTEGNAYGNLVGVTATSCDRARVAPGDLEASYVVAKLTGVGMCSGSRMPRGSAPLPDDQLETIFAWICTGAEDD
ncbi:MAG TPA: hypothetical protein VKZ63_11315 [Kofleriaceae bacterium]|nr:hypothetical protein [Kofleriaceae bacterium]